MKGVDIRPQIKMKYLIFRHLLLQIIDPYVEIELIGIPADSCKHRTKTVMDNGMP